MEVNDRELLDLAAKAAGIEISTYGVGGPLVDSMREDTGLVRWNPLNDSGDAFGLAVKLGMSILCDPIDGAVCAQWDCPNRATTSIWSSEDLEDYGNDPFAATRRAIVRTAAEVGRVHS